jgi:hypothetical protein
MTTQAAKSDNPSKLSETGTRPGDTSGRPAADTAGQQP